jgi:hypothetical protein
MLEERLGVPEVAPPQRAGHGHREHAGPDGDAGRRRAGQARGRHNQRFTECDDHDEAVAFGKMVGMQVPAFELAPDTRGAKVEHHSQRPQQVQR